MLLSHQKMLPEKTLVREETQIYWIETVNHKNFSYENEKAHELFTACLDSVVKMFDNMRVVKIKEFWNKTDSELVINNRFTKVGLQTYWKAMDASFKFNVLKQRDYLIRTNFKQMKTKIGNSVGKKLTEGKSHTAVRREDQNVTGHDMSSDQEDFDPRTLMEDMHKLFRSHRLWRECDRDAFDNFHESLGF